MRLNKTLTDWIAHEILPYEADIRRWIRASRLKGIDPDDVIQEAYCRISALSSFAHIANGRAYFFIIARNIALEHLKRQRVVSFADVSEIEVSDIAAPQPSPEQTAGDRALLQRVSEEINRLPEKSRRIFIMRRVEGLSQKEIAARLKMPESTVEKHAARGLDLLLRSFEDWETNWNKRKHDNEEKSRKRHYPRRQ